MLFDDTRAGLVATLAALGIALALGGILNRDVTAHRALLAAGSITLALRYLWWRATATLPLGSGPADMTLAIGFLALESVALASGISSAIMLARTRNRSPEATLHETWWEGPPPRVVVLVPTYNEEPEILERTLYGATGIDHADLEVWLLDDGRRPAVEALARRHGVRYLTRADNRHAKAGNINHALTVMAREGPPDFVAVFDADFVAHGPFLRRTLALFHDPDVALVQTPQHFFNPDPIQHNLGLSRSYPDEQRYFFDYLQPCRDAWGLAICCGTSSVSRWEALAEIGFLPTESVTEDFLLTVALAAKGWRTVYLNEPLSEGLAPEGTGEYVTQRARWCLGLMQIARGPFGPFSRAPLPLSQRWSLLDSALYWLGTYSFRLAAIFVPLAYWYFGTIVVDATVPEILVYFGPFLTWSLAVTAVLTRGSQLPLLADVATLVGAPTIVASAWCGLLDPRGRAFRVTDKGGDRSRLTVRWRLMAPFAALFALTLGGLFLASFSDRFAFSTPGDGKAVVVFWTLWNLVVLTLAIALCIDRPRRRDHVDDGPEKGHAVYGQIRIPVWISEMSSERARLDGIEGEPGERFALEIPTLGRFEAVVTEAVGSVVRCRFLHDDVTRRQIVLRLYTSGGAPGRSSSDPARLVLDALTGDSDDRR